MDEGYAATDYLLYPLAIYGDASYRALYALKSKYFPYWNHFLNAGSCFTELVYDRYLFEEVEAEVALAFDQLLFRLTDIVYAQFKVQASSMMLDKNYKTSVLYFRSATAILAADPLAYLIPSVAYAGGGRSGENASVDRSVTAPNAFASTAPL